MSNVKRIVLTGGPCAGKTTALVRIIEHFSNLGFKVFTVPEVPTMYSQGGWSYLTPNPKLYYEGELAILQTQLALEDSFMRLAETCTKPPSWFAIVVRWISRPISPAICGLSCAKSVVRRPTNSRNATMPCCIW